MKRSKLTSLVTLAISLLGITAEAEVVTLQPSKDNTLYEDACSVSSGAGENVFVGKSIAGVIRRGLLKFDVVSSVPPGSKVNGVMLTLHMSRTRSGSQTVYVHRVLADWGEANSIPTSGGGGSGGPAAPNDATWLHTFYDTDFWSSPGGDFVAAPSAAIDVNEVGFYTFGSTAGMIADVKNWVDNPASDFGWILIGNEISAGRTSKRFDSRENATWGFRPMLTVNFTPPNGCTEPAKSDLNGDCKVNLADFAIMSADWLKDNIPLMAQGSITITGIGTFGFDPTGVQTTRPDIFQPGHFSLFDVLVHLDAQGAINLDYHFDSNMNTHVIDAINGNPNWWFMAYYDGGWPEDNSFRMDHYPYKDPMFIQVQPADPCTIANIHSAFAEEVTRKQQNGGLIIIPEVIIRDCNYVTRTYNNVLVTAHDLRQDTFVPGTITAQDVIISMADQGLITYELQWYDSIGTAGFVRSYWVERIDDCQASGSCGFVYEEGTYGLANHIHIPSDWRVLNSPEYEKWFWIKLGPCDP